MQISKRPKTQFIVIVALCWVALGALALRYSYSPSVIKGKIHSIGKQVSAKIDMLDGISHGHDSLGRLVRYPKKQKVPCPSQTPSTAVLLAIGQSNVANHAAQKVTTHYRGQVVNYFDGECYEAASPLLGASGRGGEYLTLLADRLIEQKDHDAVIIIPAAVGGTALARWQPTGDMHAMLAQVVANAKEHYTITHILWQQGEADFNAATPTKNYVEGVNGLAAGLRAQGVAAPLYIAISTKCIAAQQIPWNSDNTVAKAQMLLSQQPDMRLAVNADALLMNADRQADMCHLSASGQQKMANAIARSMHEHAAADKQLNRFAQ